MPKLWQSSAFVKERVSYFHLSPVIMPMPMFSFLITVMMGLENCLVKSITTPFPSQSIKQTKTLIIRAIHIYLIKEP